jgi:hypothetical protein
MRGGWPRRSPYLVEEISREGWPAIGGVVWLERGKKILENGGVAGGLLKKLAALRRL